MGNKNIGALLLGGVATLIVALVAFYLNQNRETTMIVPETSTFFAVASVEEKSTLNTESDGDLWPTAWADDGYLYSANGDGKGFNLGSEWADIVVNQIHGDPESGISGFRMSTGYPVGQIWNDPALYNRKPTGMVAVGNDLYLAVQDLRHSPSNMAFNDAPSATIIKSTDQGRSWTWDTSAPMFDDYQFTTVMFLDYGKGGADNTFDEYIYAYGLDNNWRDSFTDTVEDPTQLYLARMPRDGIQDLATWEFYSGDLAGNAQWTTNMRARKPVLQDDRRVYVDTFDGVAPKDMTVISQGSIVYNKPLNRYIYTSWTEYTFEFYESPTPWGPWRIFLSKDFGSYPWYQSINGGYGTVILPKYTSSDGQTMWLNANTFMGNIRNYTFSLRKLHVVPYTPSTPENERGQQNLALPENGQDVTPISRARFRFGRGASMNNGDFDESIDSKNGEFKTEDFWGYNWSRTYHMNQLVYTTGDIVPTDGGWFKDLRIQVRQEFAWVDVTLKGVSPDYAMDASVGARTAYVFDFEDTWGDGIRIIGTPGGESTFTTFAEIEVYYR